MRQRLAQADVRQTEVAQFLAVCSRSKMVAMSTGRSRRGSRLCRRWALKWREGGQLLSQCLRATKCDKLSDCYKLREAGKAQKNDAGAARPARPPLRQGCRARAKSGPGVPSVLHQHRLLGLGVDLNPSA